MAPVLGAEETPEVEEMEDGAFARKKERWLSIWSGEKKERSHRKEKRPTPDYAEERT